MATEIEVTDEFRDWYLGLSMAEQGSIELAVTLLEEFGVALGFPQSSRIKGSELPLRELRAQHAGKPYRILYVFDPARQAVLLVGGNKAGKGNRWYGQAIRLAERLYAAYLKNTGQG